MRGALLVAPGDTEQESLHGVLPGWSPVLLQKLPFPSILVGSENDPNCSVARAQAMAQGWGSRFVNAGGTPALPAKNNRFELEMELDIVGCGRGRPAASGPVGVKELTAWPIDALVGVGAEVVALRLQQVGRQDGVAVLIKEGQRGAESRHRDAP